MRTPRVQTEGSRVALLVLAAVIALLLAIDYLNLGDPWPLLLVIAALLIGTGLIVRALRRNRG